jgi:hypothetical protein
MKTLSRTALHLAVLCIGLSTITFAADDAYLYIVHGIPGRDVAENLNPGLPVDVQVNGEVCYVRGLAFATNGGPLTLSPGDYDVKISWANSLAPCTNPSVADTTVKLSAGSSATVVIALNGSGAPSLMTFADNLKAVPSGEGRFIFAHAADAPAVHLTLTQVGPEKNPKKRTFTVNPGQEVTAELPTGGYSLEVASGTTTLLLGTVIVDNQTVDLSYLVGEASNNSVSQVTRLIRDVF